MRGAREDHLFFEKVLSYELSNAAGRSRRLRRIPQNLGDFGDMHHMSLLLMYFYLANLLANLLAIVGEERRVSAVHSSRRRFSGMSFFFSTTRKSAWRRCKST
jgi:hypothetical protein